MSRCSECKLCETADHIRLMGQGPRRAKIMVIGEAPGAREDEVGKPFQGRSGELLDALLESAGLKRKDVYITNAVKCRPPDNKTPTKTEVKKCKPWLDKEIKKVKPKFVLLLGNTALESVTGKKGIKKARGKPIEEDGILYLPTYHPAFVLRDPRQRPRVEGDLRHFSDIVNRGGARKQKGLNYRIVTEKNIEKALRDIKRTRVLGFDTETSGLDPFLPGSWVTSVGISTRKYQWCFPLNHQESPILGDIKLQRALVRRIDKAITGSTLVAHNGKFDTKWMAQVYGVWWYTTFDTMLAHYNLDENSMHDLSILSQKYFGAIDYDIPLEEKHGFGIVNT